MTFDLLAVVASFGVIFLAELPDKSMFASVILATKFNPWPVWIGLAAAFLVHGIIAVTAGQLVTYLPHRVVGSVVTILFVIGAILMFASKDEAEDGKDEAEDAGEEMRSDARVVATAFGIIFVSEWGDLTQLAAITLTARYHSPLSVLIGTVGALWLVCGLGVLLGQRLVHSLPISLVKRGAGVLLVLLAIWSFVDLLRG